MNKKYHSIFKQLYFKDEAINITSKPMMPQEFHILLYSTRVDAIANNNYMHQGLKSAFLRLIHESKNGDEIFYVFSSIAKKLQFIHLYCTLLYWVTDNFLLPYTTMANSNALKMCLRLFKNFCENYHKDPTVINRSVRSVQRTYNGETEDEYDEENGIMTFIRDFLSQAVNFINVPKCKRSKMVNDLVRKNIDGFHSRFSDSRTSQDDDDDDDEDDDDDDEEHEHNSDADVSLEDNFDEVDDDTTPATEAGLEVEKPVSDVSFETDTLPPLLHTSEPIHFDQHSLYTIPENEDNSEMYMYEGIDSNSSVLFKRDTNELDTSLTFIHQAEIHSNPMPDPEDVVVISPLPSAEEKVQSTVEKQNMSDDDQEIEKVQSSTDELLVPLFSDLQIESAESIEESTEIPNTEISVDNKQHSDSEMQRQSQDIVQMFRERKRYDRLPTYITTTANEYIPEPDFQTPSSSIEAEKQLESKLADILSEGNKTTLLSNGSSSDPPNIRKKREDSVPTLENSRFHPYKKPKFAKFTE